VHILDDYDLYFILCFNFCCFRALAYITLDRLFAVFFLFNICCNFGFLSL